MTPYKLVLATDLDGTFLEGDRQTKNSFYQELCQLRQQVLLIYVTGRPIEVVQHFCTHGYLPHPHFIIGDHGTHIVDGTTFAPIEHLQNPIIQKWNNGIPRSGEKERIWQGGAQNLSQAEPTPKQPNLNKLGDAGGSQIQQLSDDVEALLFTRSRYNHLLKELLQHEVGIQLQPIDPPYRVAYYYDPDLLQDQTVQKIREAGFDVILSSEMFLDIVPRGVNKGSSLLNLLNDQNIPHDIVITAGDSMNDLSLFQTGLKSIAVGNSEPKLVAEIQKLNNVYHSTHPGLLGIIDGLDFYKMPLSSMLTLTESLEKTSH